MNENERLLRQCGRYFEVAIDAVGEKGEVSPKSKALYYLCLELKRDYVKIRITKVLNVGLRK